MKIACIGLGRMGWHMAAHLGADPAGHEVVVYDIAAEVVGRWADQHVGTAGSSIAAAVEGADLVVTSLPADAELFSVLEEAAEAFATDAVWLDHSTTSAQAARTVAARLAERGAWFLDAPVSGGVDGARNGSLTVMVGGDSGAFDRVESVMEAYAGRVTLMGESGAGQITKMTNQICVVGVCQALAEGLDFASRAGLDVDNVVKVMLQGSSTSWQMENRADQMLNGEYDFGFATTLMRKDIGLVLDEARAMNVSLPVTALVGQFLADVDALGGADWDWCSLMERQRHFDPARSQD